jgi:hypothetical protein
MRYLRTFGLFWYDFVVGDDWRVAVGVVATISVAFLAAHHGARLWWLLPLAVAALLGLSLARATRPAVPTEPGSAPTE